MRWRLFGHRIAELLRDLFSYYTCATGHLPRCRRRSHHRHTRCCARAVFTLRSDTNDKFLSLAGAAAGARDQCAPLRLLTAAIAFGEACDRRCSRPTLRRNRRRFRDRAISVRDRELGPSPDTGHAVIVALWRAQWPRLGAGSANLGQTAHYSQAIAHFVDRRARTCTPTTTPTRWLPKGRWRRGRCTAKTWCRCGVSRAARMF